MFIDTRKIIPVKRNSIIFDISNYRIEFQKDCAGGDFSLMRNG